MPELELASSVLLLARTLHYPSLKVALGESSLTLSFCTLVFGKYLEVMRESIRSSLRLFFFGKEKC